MVKLSLMICTLTERRPMLEHLLSILQPQVDLAGPEVEICIDEDQRQVTTGVKRNRMVAAANGEFCAFIDDDDTVSNDYVSKVLGGIRENPDVDCVGLVGIITFNGNGPRRFIHSISCDGWYERNGFYYRTPNHLNAIRRSLVLQVPYPPITIGEDKAFSDGIRPLLKTEAPITEPIYHYLYRC